MKVECLNCGNVFTVSPDYRGTYTCICGAVLYLVSGSDGKLTRYYQIDESLLEFVLEETAG